MIKLKNQHGDICNPIQAEGWTAEQIADRIRKIASENGIPCMVCTDTATTGGLFGTEYPCVVVEHPNPPQSYFDHWIVINGNVINFYFGGMSKANYDNNRREMHANSGKLSGLLKSALISDKSMELQTEQLWHNQIMAIYQEIWFGE